MDISSLQYFIATAQIEHMGRAAEQLHITQPTLSVAIKRLEAELGYQLFDRSGRGIHLNAYGKLLLESAVRIDAELTHCLAEMERTRFNTVEYCRIWCSPLEVESKLISKMLARGIRLKLTEIREDWESALMQNLCDFALTMAPAGLREVESIPLREMTLRVVVGGNHPLCTLESVSVKDVMRYAFSAVEAPFSLVSLLKSAFPHENFDPHFAFYGRVQDDLIEALQTGRYVGVMEEKEALRHPELRLLDVRDLHLTAPLFLHRRAADAAREDLGIVVDAIREFYGTQEVPPQ